MLKIMPEDIGAKIGSINTRKATSVFKIKAMNHSE